jgi:hypothetical protein
MAKIKKLYRYLIFLTLLLIILSGSSFLLLRNQSVQTYLGHKIFDRISDNIRGAIVFKTMKFTLFNRVTFEDILILDETKDTLIYSPVLNLGIRKLDRKNRSLRLGRIYAENPVIGIRPDSTGRLNILYFVDLITPEDTAKRNRDLSINQIRIVDGRATVNLAESSGEKLKNLKTENLNITIDDLDKHYDKFNMTLSELSFNTDDNFRVTSIFSEVDVSKDHFYLVDPTIRTSASFINSDIIGIDFTDRDSIFSFMDDARLNLKFNRSLISLADIGFFVDKLADSDETFILSGTINGTVSELKGRNIELEYSGSTRIGCDFDFSGLPDIANTFMFIDVEDMITTTEEIESFNIPGYGYINLGDEVRRLGTLSFNGNFTGFLTDFVTYGKFKTDIGSLSTDILFRPDSNNTFIYKGSLKTMGFDIGRFIDQQDILGILSVSADIDGSSESFDIFNARLKGEIDTLQFKGYQYHDILLEGIFTEKIWDGTITTDTRDLKMALLGRFDFSGEEPEFDFTLNLLDADLFKLNLYPDDTTSRLSMLLTANFEGSNIDNIDGEIRLLNSRLTLHSESFDMYDASLIAGNEGDVFSIEFKSDYIDADIKGKYNLRSVFDDLVTAGARLSPALFSKEESLYRITNNNFEYNVAFKNTDPVNKFFRTGINLAQGSRISGRVDPDSLITLRAEGDYFVFNNNSLVDFDLFTIVEDSAMNIFLQSHSLNLLNRFELQDFKVRGNTVYEDFTTGISWVNKGNLKNSGEVKVAGHLIDLTKGKTGIEVDMKETSIFVRDQEWKIHPSRFSADSSSLQFSDFMISHGDDYFSVNGKASSYEDDTLAITFKNLKLDALNSLSRKEINNSEGVDFLIDGEMDGEILLKNIFDNFLFESDILISDFSTNEHKHGDIRILSQWDNIKRLADISLKNNINNTNTIGVEGTYNPESKEIDFKTKVDDFPLDALNLVLYSFSSGIKGFGSGSVRVTGTAGEPKINGSIMARNTSMTIDYLKTKFNFSDSIIMDNTGFRFRNISLTDERGNRATLDGYVAHNSFNDFGINLKINADNILVMDTRQKDNSLFYGTAYATGVISITGPATSLRFDVSARTGRNTKLFIPLDQGVEVTDYSFISFTSSDTTNRGERVINLPFASSAKPPSIELNFDLEVTPDAEVQLVFDSKVGDVMRGRGSGNLNLSLNKGGDFAIFGDYVIEDGDYLFTLGNIFNKRFIVEEGGTISWDGNITDADVDIKAIYKLRTSLFELLQDEAFRQRIPIDCHLNMTGKLINPMIGFDIYLPTADEQTRTYLRNAINTEEEMSRQFLYLLVMNSFYPSSSYATAINTTSAGASAMGVTTTEMLSNQLSNWLSQISNDFDIGFAYRPGNEISSQEVEVALSTQLLNDRVIINGNFDVGGQETSSATNDITGDFDVEVKLTEKVRFKVFNRSNDNIHYETAPYTQGFGLFYRQDFNRFIDIFKKNKGDMKKEEETAVETVEK